MQKQTKEAKLEHKVQKQRMIRRFGIIALLLLLFYAMAYGANNRIEVTEYTYKTNALSVSFNHFRIVQLSDLHSKMFPEKNESILRELNELHPDIIVLTGDFVDGFNHTNVDHTLIFMQQIKDIAPCYFVLGNHEHYLDKSVLEDFVKRVRDYGIHLLDNETVQISSATGQTFSLIGLDDLSLQANILTTLAEEAPDDFQVLLAHEPQYLRDNYAASGVDIVLSGHAHGGQWRIPFLNQGLFAPDQGLLPKMTAGEFTEDGTTMYISRGLGNSAFPLRLFNHPEIVSVTLQTVAADPE